MGWFSKPKQQQKNIDVPNPETSHPKAVIRFIETNSTDIVKQVYHQLQSLYKIPDQLNTAFQNKISGNFLYLHNPYWNCNAEEFQIKEENLDAYNQHYSFELKGVHVKEYRHILDTCCVFDMVELKKEPYNKYDTNAIKVTYGNRIIGRVPGDETGVIHQIIKNDHKAFIETVFEDEGYLTVTIKIYYNGPNIT